jgi:hypothetical protein
MIISGYEVGFRHLPGSIRTVLSVVRVKLSDISRPGGRPCYVALPMAADIRSILVNGGLLFGKCGLNRPTASQMISLSVWRDTKSRFCHGAEDIKTQQPYMKQCSLRK